MTPTEILPSEYHDKLKLDRGNVFADDSYLSKSTIWQLFNSSLYKWRYFSDDFQPTPAMSWGSMVDCLVTAPEDFENQFIVSPFDSFRTKEARLWRDEKSETGASIVTGEQIEQAHKAAEILTKKHKYSADIIERSQSQVVMVNRIEHPAASKPVNLKALADFVPEGTDYLVDLKTTNDISADALSKTIGRFGYHVQGNHYLNMWNMLNPDDQRKRFLIIWQESKPPYEVAVTEIPEADIADGADIFNHLLGQILRAAEKNWWPMKFEKPVLLGRSSFSVYNEGQEIDGYTTAP